jgi:hypothetical protein
MRIKDLAVGPDQFQAIYFFQCLMVPGIANDQGIRMAP